MIADQFWFQFYRMRLYVDIAGLRLLLRFRGLRHIYYRQLWAEAASSLGASISDWGFGFQRIERDGLSTTVRLSEVMLDDHLTLDIMGNKALTYALLEERGCAVPAHCCFSMRRLAVATEFMNRNSGPFVVKPNSGTGGGRGVTTGITTPAELRRAARLAARYDKDLLIETQIAGNCYRLLVLDGRLIDAIRRDPPTVTGDGRSSIRRLVRNENRRRTSERPVTALSPLVIDQDCRNWLAGLGLAPSSRLVAGQRVRVKRAANENCAAENTRVLGEIHPATAALVTRLSRQLGVRFAGVDVICRDLSAPLTPDNGMIGEINTTPGIHHHYLVSNRADHVPVAELVLAYMFTGRHGVMTASAAMGHEAEPGQCESAAAVALRFDHVVAVS